MNTATIASVFRHLLTFGGGYLAAKGIELDGETIQALAGGFAALVGVIWGIIQKKKQPASLD